MTNRINKILNKLKETIVSGNYNCHFEEPSTLELVESVEKCLEITLPDSYKRFLLRFNGGYICDDKLEEIIKRDHNTETAVWNSCNILSVEEMMQEYIDLSDRQWKLYQWEGIYPVIPFGRTNINELLIFILPLDDNNESPVFDAFHEDPMNDWGVISVDFAEFLERYLETKGQLNCISSSDTGIKQHQFAQSGWKMSAEDSGNSQDIIDKMTACLKFNPEDSWNFTHRGRAYLSLNDYDNALNDLNQSLHLYPDYAYAYYLRGGCYLRMKKYSHALSDFSIAVEKEPHDLYYITQRASAWCKLGDYKRAIEETSKVIDIDNEFELAYMTRYEAYLAIGEDEKADDDANIINGLQ